MFLSFESEKNKLPLTDFINIFHLLSFSHYSTRLARTCTSILNFFSQPILCCHYCLRLKLFGLARFWSMLFCFYREFAKMTAVKSIDVQTYSPFAFWISTKRLLFRSTPMVFKREREGERKREKRGEKKGREIEKKMGR